MVRIFTKQSFLSFAVLVMLFGAALPDVASASQPAMRLDRAESVSRYIA
jgi:hypothetical protein